MGISVNEAVTTWNTAAADAETELKALEDTLKADYNKYIDSLSAYLKKINDTNAIRNTYVNVFEKEDIENSTYNKNNFLYSAVPPLQNIGEKYILDNSVEVGQRDSYEIVKAADAEKLLTKKVI
ncbi:hypothetical protein HMPREF1982_02685 [Clostridiales bacterium oral taxon 876 str. F0540]|nr:hypothetical protein HMPREF1982_02685 [Clostridiales bacterium oral taxon 876 str. F0540]